MTAAKARQGPNVLIVDDKQGNLLLLERMLTERGYRARPVLSGEVALQEARKEQPDLILLDIAMPDMDGYEVCEQLKADPALKDIPVIFISALNETFEKVKAFKAGGVDYVTAPFHFEEVYARVRTHLQLRRLEKLRDDLTQMVVHDLRNPLTAIFGFLDFLDTDEDQQLTADGKALATATRRSAEEMLNLIGSILDVSKMGEGEMQLRPEPCDLDKLMRAVLAANQPLPGNRTVTLDAPHPPATVRADAGLIRRVFQNLLSNALKYTPEGGDVRIAVTPCGNDVRVTITDTGPGIATEDQERIFEKFGQVENRTNRLGTGLGLTFCKMAVEAHGGHIGVESELGKGSTFWLALPRGCVPQ